MVVRYNYRNNLIFTESYRSGHNEAVLKTVWVQAHGGSNPSLSANGNLIRTQIGLGYFLLENFKSKKIFLVLLTNLIFLCFCDIISVAFRQIYFLEALC